MIVRKDSPEEGRICETGRFQAVSERVRELRMSIVHQDED